jgi:meromycolic acid enoyl-[acyl-carrier protein] reductase
MLAGKKILVTGVLTRESIAFAVAERAQEYGAEIILTSYGRARRLTERAARRLNSPDVLTLDVTSEQDFEALASELATRWGGLDGALHAIAGAPSDAMGGRFMDAPRDSVLTLLEVSAVSLKTMGNALLPLFEARGGGSIVGMSFDTSAAWPSYDWMGVAKNTLEAVNRYLAANLGPHGVRANLVSAGLLLTESAKAIPGFHEWAEAWQRQAPIGWDATDAYPVADAVCFLLSDAARGISGEILNVDGGRHAVAGALALVDDGAHAVAGEDSTSATGVAGVVA